MNNKIPCELIEDLLPLYVDNLTSEKTSKLINEHLECCLNCKQKYQSIITDINQSDQITSSEIDYLKKVKAKNTKKIIISLISLFIVLSTLFVLKVYVLGSPTSKYEANVKVENNNIIIEGQFSDSNLVYSSHKIINVNKENTLRNEENQTKVIIYASKSSIINEQNKFYFEIPFENKEIHFNNGISVSIQEDIISKLANNLYDNKNPYIGDISRNVRIAEILDIYNKLGNFSNQLYTDNEPYGWRISFEKEVNSLNEELFNATMTNNAYVLLATINNADYIIWDYKIGNKKIEKTITKQDASSALGEDIKSFAESPTKLQELLDTLGLN